MSFPLSDIQCLCYYNQISAEHNVILKAGLSLACDTCSMTASRTYYHIMYNVNHLVNKVASFYEEEKITKQTTEKKKPLYTFFLSIHFSHQTMFHMLNILFTREKYSKTSHYALRSFSPKGCF